MRKVKIMIVDDHGIFRDGVKLVISQTKDYEVVAEAGNGVEFLDFLNIEIPDIVLMDISMPVMDGVKATQLALEKYPGLKVITLSMFGDEEYYFRMIELGVKAVVLKNQAQLNYYMLSMRLQRGIIISLRIY
jgi:DNA-binding NarL/FixJ family response regulator